MEEVTSGQGKNVHRFSCTRLVSRIFNQSHQLSIIFWLAFLCFTLGFGFVIGGIEVCDMVVCGCRLPT